MSKVTVLATTQLNGADSITVQLIRPTADPAIVRVLWPTLPTVVTPQRFPESAAAIVRMFAAAHPLSWPLSRPGTGGVAKPARRARYDVAGGEPLPRSPPTGLGLHAGPDEDQQL